jgi:hypothetical protein
VVVCLLRYMLRNEIMTRDELLAAARLYVLMAFVFAYLYALVEQWQPGADGDWVGGQCAFVTGNQLVVPVQTSGLPANATTGTALCSFIETFQNNTRLIDLQLIDRAGHPSNVLAGQATLEGRSPKP